MTTKQVQNQNGTTEYIVQGTGETIVFLHGAGASATANWQSSIDFFSKGKKVISINLPSAGSTTWNKATLELTDLVNVVKSVIEAEGDNSVTLVGYSTGAIVALAYGGTYPNEVKKIIAMAPWLVNPRQKFFFDFWGKLLKTDKELFARYNTITALSINAHGYMNDEAFEGTAQVFGNTGFNQDLPKLIEMLVSADIEPFLSTITSKVKIIGFSFDLIAPVNLAKEISSKIVNALFSEIQAGHAGPWEATDKMNEEIANFI
jgi:pimeloyl-ACP methyl ester carboxylesterase